MTGSARLVACLSAMFALASCTSSDGINPPAEIGSSGQAMQLSATAAPASGNLAPAPALAPTTPASGAAAPAVASAAPTGGQPAFAGPEPSSAATMPPGNGQVAALASSSSIQFAPITGTTPEAAQPLSERLAARARERGIALAGGGTQPAYILKGYFSEVSDGGATTVIYVWDVMDGAGNRLHRIQGQARAKGAGGWSSVSAETMQAIANRTIDELAQWLSTRTG